MVNVSIKVLSAVSAMLLLAACSNGQPPQTTGTTTTSAPVTVADLASEGIPVTPRTAEKVQSIAAAEVNSAVLSSQACSLDTIDGKYDAMVTVPKGKATVFRGWVQNDQQKPAGAFEVVLVGHGNFSVAAKTGLARPDVASSLKSPSLANAGFNVLADLRSLPLGKYSLRFLMQTDGKTYWCDTKKTITLQ